MDESDFEGTLVLEQLAVIGLVEDFFDSIVSWLKRDRGDPTRSAGAIRS